MKNITLSILAIFAAFTIFSCSSDDTEPLSQEEIKAQNEAAILDYLSENQIVAESTESGLYYVIDQEGNDVYPTVDDSIEVTYKGYNLAGEVFDQSTDAITFLLSDVIPGWQEGMQYFSEGATGILFIPSHLAYGPAFPSNNMPIVFEVKLVEVVQ